MLGLHQVGSRPTFFVPRWATHPRIPSFENSYMYPSVFSINLLTPSPFALQSQEEEVAQLRNAITERKREEASLLQQAAERRTRVEAVENENKSISARNEQVRLICLFLYFQVL